MATQFTIKTERLILRPWCDEDLEPFAKLNGDPRVMEHFPAIKSFEESSEEFHVFREEVESAGWGLWAASLIEGGDFIGLIGLKRVRFDAHFTPAVEIGWRLAYEYWGKGYATEGALACLKYGFETLNLDEIVSLTSIHNKRSENVMKKIGMTRNPAEDFDHPRIAEGDRLRRHVLYRISNPNQAIHVWDAPPKNFQP